jgi:hypothetical protein
MMRKMMKKKTKKRKIIKEGLSHRQLGSKPSKDTRTKMKNIMMMMMKKKKKKRKKVRESKLL